MINTRAPDGANNEDFDDNQGNLGKQREVEREEREVEEGGQDCQDSHLRCEDY